ncbi:BaiN/RdsA family NAD(P)/FAD-dependent oxidoreductase [Membranihabitans marinus]|uniref:NAD(P)/FAD-dependent oxidoreductase n=1 Tax=Membranihabitans marinus TaxID=1227546 RepID=UPI001F2371EA|nr:TIGR03862 family flavoprotein [Membranihabitans marinus]
MKKSIAIIGGGSAGLFLATFLDSEKWDISLYEQQKTLGRKFLVAGDGGFNLTHSDTLEWLIQRYSPSSFLQSSLSRFTNNDFQQYLGDIGIPTFIGSSKRVFPKEGIKPIHVLNAFLEKIQENKVKLFTQYRWQGWLEGQLIFETPSSSSTNIENQIKVIHDISVFALGGGSWKITGSTGDWLSKFQERGVKCQALYPSNCGYQIEWPVAFIEKAGGQPLKNISISVDDQNQKGEVVITNYGLEGNAIYALSPTIRKYLQNNQPCTIEIDLKPQLSEEEINHRIKTHSKEKMSYILRQHIKLSPIKVMLLKTFTSKDDFLHPHRIAHHIKGLKLIIHRPTNIDQAISTVGGIELSEVNEDFEFHKIPNNYCIGEMLNWDAPTGGYLLQGCASMAHYLAQHLNRDQ